MIVPSGAVRVLVATRPVDFRKGMNGLAAVVREHVGADPYSGVVYVFRAKRADRAKLLVWDGSGLVNLTPRNLCKGESVRLDSLRQRGCSASAGALGE
jgi:transposase